MENRNGFENPLAQKAAVHLKEMMEQGMHSHADYVSPETYRSIIDKQGDLRGKKIVELGSGIVRIGLHPIETNYEEALVGKGATLIPVDVVEETIKTWNITKDQEMLKVAPLQADILKLPFPDESIDGCISANVVNFYPTIENPDCHVFAYRLLKESHRVLKKGGFIIVSSFGYTRTTHKNGAVTYNNKIQEYQTVRASELRHMAHQIGFSDIEEVPLSEEQLRNATKMMNAKLPEGVAKKEIEEACGFLFRK